MDIKTTGLRMVEIRGWMDEFLWPEPDGKQRAKRARILASATRLFVRFGYRKTSIDEIAKAAGVAKGTVYLYYRNKAELLLHAIGLEKMGSLDRLEPLLAADMAPTERLRGLIAIAIITMQEMPLLSSLTGGDHELTLALGEVDASVLARIDGWRAEFMIGLLAEAADRRLSRHELKERAEVLIDLITGVVLSGTLTQKGAELNRYAWVVAGSLVSGIVAAPALLDVPGAWLQQTAAAIDTPLLNPLLNKEAAI